MAREIKKACAAGIEAVTDGFKAVTKVVNTFADSYKANTKIEVAENLMESSVPGGTPAEKAKNASDIYASLIGQIKGA